MKLNKYVIVTGKTPSFNEKRAAAFLREKIRLVCGALLPLVTDDVPASPYEIVVGETQRETETGFPIPRGQTNEEAERWEYLIQTQGTRLFLSGLGASPQEPRPFTSSYRSLNDGKIGTVMAAYRFTEEILGYDFLYSAFEDFPVNPDLEMPAHYSRRFTRQELRKQEPVLYDGAALYVLPCAEELHWNMGSMILKTKKGSLIVIDGGHASETERFLHLLQTISKQTVPRISAWLFSHLHSDHYGVYHRLCTDPAYRGAVKVEDFYCNLATEEFYTTFSNECFPGAAEIRRTLLESHETVGARVHTVQTGDEIQVDEIHFEVLHVPDLRFASQMNMNDSSVVYKMTYDNKQSMMLLGDAEYVCSNDLTQNQKNKLKSDIVQVGHHGCGNVSAECYERIGAKAYLWQIGEKFWYSENGEALNAHNTGVIRTRAYMMENPPKKENVHVVMRNLFCSPLPLTIH